MNYEDWLAGLNKLCDGKFQEIVCPFFKKNKCDIYQVRFKCCRHFPVTGGYCFKNICLLAKNKIKKNTRQSRDICQTCGDVCCKKILIPDKIRISKDFIKKWMNIDCETCKKFFK